MKLLVKFKRIETKEKYFEMKFNSWLQFSNFMDDFYNYSNEELYLKFKIFKIGE